MTLKEMRMNKNMTTTAVARAAGISQGTYSNIETGRRSTTPLMTKKIADALEISFSDVFTAINEIPRRTHRVGSWVSEIRIDKLPLVKAFKYHAKAEKINTNDTSVLKQELADFVSENITRSLLLELSERKNLLNKIQIALSE